MNHSFEPQGSEERIRIEFQDVAHPYVLEAIRDGDCWAYRRRWTEGVRSWLPALWHRADELPNA